ncbi:MAG: YegP family protein [Devosia sp.]
MTKGEAGKGYRFEIDASKDEQFFVRFVASNGETMVRSERYKQKASAVNAIESVKKNGPEAEVVDES